MNQLTDNPFYKAKLSGKPLILDGAIGSLLQQKGFETDDILWTTNVNFNAPGEVIKIHRDYIAAGADIITTNTFRTNPYSLEQAGIFDIGKYVEAAVNLAKTAARGHNILIAGSNAPAEDCYKKERDISESILSDNHCKHIDLLIDNGVDFILNETQSHFDEIKIICNYCNSNNIPYVISLYLDENLDILSGEALLFVMSFIREHNPLAIGINCISIEQFKKVFDRINLDNFNWGFYLNCGAGKPTDKNITCGVSPSYYAKIVSESLSYNPSFVGSCCGSSPGHIKAIRKVINESNSN